MAEPSLKIPPVAAEPSLKVPQAPVRKKKHSPRLLRKAVSSPKLNKKSEDASSKCH